MKRFAVAGGLMLAAFAGVVLADDKALKDLEGTYTTTVLEKGTEKGPKPAPKDLVDSMRVTIKGDDLTIRFGEDEKKAKIKADASKTPNTVDIIPADGDLKGKTLPGIYKFEKGELTMVFTEKGERPKEFKTEGDVVLMKLKKIEDKK
jgi:uncharacterized protein (TIGR03067 family)